MTITETKPAKTQTKRLAGKIALVTGGSRGIGAEIARKLADEGATVVAVTYSKSREQADQLVNDINNRGTKGFAYKADASSVSDAQQLIKEIKDAHGKIDILVNNAGVANGGSIEEVGADQFDYIFGVNVRGVIATTHEALKLMPEGGRIINISSVAAKASLPAFSIYSASKAALDALTRIWAQDLGHRKITVNGVAPGATQTDMYEQATTAEEKQHMTAKTALGRVGQPDDIAEVVAFLASEDARWITGQTLVADGGINI